MNANFNEKFNVVRFYMNKIVAPVAIIGLIGGIWFSSFWGILIAVTLLLLAFLSNCVWFVPTGYVGFKRVFSKLQPESYQDGINWKIPWITDTILMNIQVQTRDIVDRKKTVTRNDLDMEGTLTYQLEEEDAYLVYQLMGSDYYNTHLSKWVDAILDNMVSKLAYPHFQAEKALVEEWASKLIASGIAKMCSDITEEVAPRGISFESVERSLEALMTTVPDPVDSSKLITIPVLKSVATGEDTTEMVPEFILNEADVILPGVNLFRNVSLKINKIKFEAQYEEARSKVAVAKAKVQEEEQRRQQMLITLKTNTDITRQKAEAEADAIRAKAQAEAEALKLKGASENEVREKLGVILNSHPELIQEVLAKNFPKVFGGNGATPLIDLGSMLK